MFGPEYEVVVVGGGPAGLSAARSAARLGFRTLLLERLARPGDLAHPCGGVIAPVPGLVSLERSQAGLYSPELDLHLPQSLVLGVPAQRRYTSPGGQALDAGPSGAFPVAVIDPSALLRLLSEQAGRAGAELAYGASVIGLLQEGKKIAGVRTTRGNVRAAVVLSAEGSARYLCEEAGLYSRTAAGKRFAFTVSQHMDAPAVSPEHLGQIVTLGHRYTSAREAFGIVVLPAPGRATVYFTVFADRAKDVTVQSCWDYLDEYVASDPRVQPLFRGAQILSRAGHRTVLREGPRRLVRDGFMGLGDAVSPAAHLGILPAIYSGRQAALTAAEAIDVGDTSASCLAGYSTLFHSSVPQGMEAESKLMMSLTGMADDEIDRLFRTLQTLRLGAPFFSAWRSVAWDTVGSLFRALALAAHDWELEQRALRDAEKTEDQNELLPIPLGSLAAGQFRPLAVPDRISALPLRFRVLT